MRRTLLVAASALAFASGPLVAQDRAEVVRKDRKDLEDDDYWIYNDLAKGIATARRTGKPLLVVFR